MILADPNFAKKSEDKQAVRPRASIYAIKVEDTETDIPDYTPIDEIRRPLKRYKIRK